MKNIKLRYYLRGLGIGILVMACIMTVMRDKKEDLTDEQIIERATELGMVDGNNMVLSDLRDSAATDEEPDSEVAEDAETEQDSEVAEDAETEQDSEVAEDTETEQDSEVAEDAETEQDSEVAEDTETEQDSEVAEDTGMEPDSESTSENTEKEQSTESTQDTETEPEVDNTQDTEPQQDKEEAFITEDTVTLIIRPGANSYTVSKKLEEMGLVADAKGFDKYLCNNGYDNVVRVGIYDIVMGTAEEEIAKIITGKR